MWEEAVMSNGDWNRCAVTQCYNEQKEEEALFSDPQNIPSVETLKDIELTIRRVSL
jgi:hypothetical protein